MFLLQGVVHVTSQCSCGCYGILHLLLLSLFPDSILEYVASESTLSSGSDSLALSQAAKEREKSLFEDKKVCVCAYMRVCVVCTFVCLCVCCWCSVGIIDHGRILSLHSLTYVHTVCMHCTMYIRMYILYCGRF